MTPRQWPFQRADALPTYAFLAVEKIKTTIAAGGADIIDLGLGNPDRATPEPIVQRLHEASDVGKNHRYHPGRGLPALRQAFVGWYERRYCARFDPDEDVIVTMGAKEGISHLCLAILDRGDVVLVPDPCYPIHQGAPAIAGAEVVGYPSTAAGAPAEVIGAAIAKAKASGTDPKLVIANYPQNPTGAVVTRDELGNFVRAVRDSGAMLLHDLAYADLDFSSRHAPSIFDCGVDRDEVESFAVEVFSMSKSYSMPGWRIGFMAGNSRLIGALAHIKGYLDYGTFMPIQHAAAWALDHGDDLVSDIRGMYEKRAKHLVESLRAAGWGEVDEPRGTMFVWTKLPDRWKGETSLNVTRRLIEEAHVAVTPGSGFGPAGEGYVRFSLIEDPPRIAEACDRIQKVLGG